MRECPAAARAIRRRQTCAKRDAGSSRSEQEDCVERGRYRTGRAIGPAATSPIIISALDAIDGRIKQNDLLVLEEMGGGLSWGSAVVRWYTFL
jgi:hypothetical protein